MTARERWRSRATGLAVGALIGLLAHELDLKLFVSYWYDDLIPLAFFAFVCALVWPSRLRSVLAATAVVLGLVFLLAAFSPLAGRITDGLDRRDPLDHADAVYVLSSWMHKDGSLSSPAMSRLLHGLELVSQGYATRLVLSELPPPRASYAGTARALIDNLHVQTELLVVAPIHDTHEEAVAVARLCRERGWKRLLVVTSPVHSRRASAAFEHEGLEVIASPSTETRYDLRALDTPTDRLTAFGNAMHERIGLWVYKRRGWI